MDIEAIKPKIKSLAEKYGLDFVVLFGSQARGTTHSKSDVDVGYSVSRELTLDERFSMNSDLCELFGREDVESVNLKRTSPLLMKIIAQEAVLLHESVCGAFSLFRLYAERVYRETERLRQSRYQSLKRFIYGRV